MFWVLVTPRLEVKAIYSIYQFDDVLAALCLLLFLGFKQYHRSDFKALLLHLLFHVGEKLSGLDNPEHRFSPDLLPELGMSFFVYFVQLPSEFANRTVEFIFDRVFRFAIDHFGYNSPSRTILFVEGE